MTKIDYFKVACICLIFNIAGFITQYLTENIRITAVIAVISAIICLPVFGYIEIKFCKKNNKGA